jgi:hypothetical protein
MRVGAFVILTGGRSAQTRCAGQWYRLAALEHDQVALCNVRESMYHLVYQGKTKDAVDFTLARPDGANGKPVKRVELLTCCLRNNATAFSPANWHKHNQRFGHPDAFSAMPNLSTQNVS